MIVAVLRASWLGLRRDRVAQLLTFVVPIAFFSLMTLVLGGGRGGGTPRLELVLVDQDQSPVSRRLVAALLADPRLEVRRQQSSGAALTAAEAEARVSAGEVSAAAVIRPGFGAALDWFGGGARVALYVDSADPMATPMLTGILQQATVSAAPDVLIERAVAHFERLGGPLSAQQRQTTATWLRAMRAIAPAPVAPLPGGAADTNTNNNDTNNDDTNGPKINGNNNTNNDNGAATSGQATDAGPPSEPNSRTGFVPTLDTDIVAVEVIDLLSEGPSKSPVNAFYAAGIAVMFLLFSATGTAGVLLEEEQQGTLERLLCAEVTMGTLLAGRWLFATLLGTAQVTLMFVWGALFFDVELFTAHHLLGFLVMTLVTTSAAAGFGLCLAALCRTRAQLDGVGTLVILLMSATGGSMMPRFLMPEWIKDVGLVTFNAWALDGYQKVFWYETELVALWPQVSVLAGLGVVFLVAARRLARRWERG